MSIIFSVQKLRRSLERYLFGVVYVAFFICVLSMAPVPTHASSVEVFNDRPFIFTIFDEVVRQLGGVAMFTAQAIDAVLVNTIEVDNRGAGDSSTEVLPLYDDISGFSLGLPFTDIGEGTFIINAPLVASNQFTVKGDSSLSTTTISGLLTTDSVNGNSLTISGRTQLQSLRVAAEASISRLVVQGSAIIESLSTSNLSVNGVTELTGLLEANGGIETNGADVNLGDGSLFADNVINKIRAGTYIQISGTKNEPRISVTIDEGVTKLNGVRGSVTLLGGDDISISGVTITSSSTLASVVSRGGCPDCILDAYVSDGLTIASGTIDATVIGSTTPAIAYFTETTVGATTSTTTLLTVQGTGTSSFGGGIDLLSGCFSINGTCVASAASSTYLGLGDTPNSFVANAIQYVNGAADAVIHSSSFVFDGTSLGIGTSSPSETLSVVGSALLTGDITLTGDVYAKNGSTIHMYDTDSSNYVALRASSTLLSNTTWILPTGDGNSDEVLVTNGNGDLRFEPVSAIGGGVTEYLNLIDTPASFTAGAIHFANASGTALTESSDLSFDGTSLGIGTDTPTDELTVYGGIYVGFDSITPGIVYNDAANAVSIGTTDYSEKLNIEGGTLLQKGGSVGSTYEPRAIASVNLPDSATAVHVTGDKAYVTTSQSGNDFSVIDISDRSAPTVVGSLSLSAGANDVYVSGKYAYVVTDVGGDDFHVIDISNGSSPAEVGSLNLPTSAKSVTVQGRYAYVTSANTGDDFHVVDITDPSDPLLIGAIDLGADAQDVEVSGDYAFVVTATPDIIMAIDISDQTNPTVVSSTTLSSDGEAIKLKGSFVYVATSPLLDDFHIFDVSDPLSLTSVGSLALSSGATEISVAGAYAYVTTSGTGDDMHVIDIRDSSNPTEVGSVEISAAGLGVMVAGRYAYITSESTGDDFHIYDITGVEAQSVSTQSLETGTLSILGDFTAAGKAFFSSGLRAGSAGIQTDGTLLVQGSGGSIFNGTVAIGTTTPTNALTVEGDILVYGGTATFDSVTATNLLGGAVNITTDLNGNIIRDPSDVRLKTDIVTLDDALDSLMQLRGVRYMWRDVERFGTQAEIGFIAQEVDLVLPEVVRKGGEYWSINTRNILAVVVEAVKEIWIELQGTQGEVDELRSRIEDLELQLEDVAEPEEAQDEETDDDSDSTDSSEVAPVGSTTAEPDTQEQSTEEGSTEVPEAQESNEVTGGDAEEDELTSELQEIVTPAPDDVSVNESPSIEDSSVVDDEVPETVLGGAETDIDESPQTAEELQEQDTQLDPGDVIVDEEGLTLDP